ncbi:MAG: TonB-dependent receptor [Hyphomonadaceae bacterium]|nr:TonB-dependent receptor [Hyphomonadaceae bacterium]
MRTKSKLLLACCAIALAVAAPAAAWAQEENEIIVTATHRSQSLQDVPFSINAQTAEDIQRTGAQNLEDLSRNVAGLSIQNLGPGQSQVAIRGVSAGQIVRDQPGVKEQVGVYLDESVISLSLFTPDLDLYDLNRVETLRGPQGTLFGSGSVGGTLRYITNQPDLNSFEGSLEADVNTVTDGSEGGSVRGMVNVPFANGTAALRAVGYYTAYPGFIDARRLDGSVTEDVNDGYRSGARIALTIQPTSNLTLTPRVVYQKIDVNGFNREEVFNLYRNPFTTPALNFGEREQFLLLDEEFNDETILADLTATLSLDRVDITSVTSYTHREILVSRDASALTGSVSVDVGLPDVAVLLPSNLRDTTELDQFTQEIRVVSNTPGPFQWLVGAFYSDADRTYQQRLPTPGYDFYIDAGFGAGTSAGADNGFGLIDNPYHADLPYTNTQFAIFGEGSYDFTDRLTVTVGGRYYDFSEERRFHSGGFFSNTDDQVDSTDSNGVSPRVLVTYDVSDDLIWNAQVAKGFRLGGANDPLNIPLCSADDAATFGGFPRFDDETLWNYETGFKYQGNRVSLNAAAYYTSIEDLQVSADAGSCSSRVVFNVPEAHTAGIEAELSASPIDGLELTFAASVLESQFDSSLLDAGGDVIAGIRKGNRLPSTPEYQLAATAAYYWDTNWFGPGTEAHIAATAQHMGSRYTQPADQEPGAGVFVSNLPFAGAPGTDATVLDLELESYTILNLNAGIDTGDWAVQVYVNNVTDENAHLAFDRERGGRARLGFHVNQPRTFGVTLRRSF